MSDERSDQCDLPDASDAELDRLIANARFPEASLAAQQRLADAWTEIRARRSLTLKTATWTGAVAAVLIVGVGMWWRLAERVDPNARRTYMMSNTSDDRAPIATTTPAEVAVWREPTLAEELIVRSAAARSGGVRNPVTSKQLYEQTRDALAEVTRDPNAAYEVAQRLKSSVGASRTSRRLIELAQSRLTVQRVAVVRLLSEIGDASALPVLSQVSHDPAMRDAALPGVIRLSDSASLAALYNDEKDASVRQELLAAMLARGDGVSILLPRVRDHATRAEALALVRELPNPPVDALLAALNSPCVDERFAAAKALAEVCDDGHTGTALRRMVEQNKHRREALAALMLCRDPAAVAFLAEARASRSIDAEIRSLELQLSNRF